MASLRDRFQNVRLLASVAAATILLALLIRFLVFPIYQIPSLSMAPTLDQGDRVLVNRFSYSLGEIERGQVVVFGTPPSQPSDADVFIKRVIGLPGETVRFVDGEVYIDGLLVVEPYLMEPTSSWLAGRRIPGCAQETATVDRCVVPDGHVFVLGDNREGSEDSRIFGPIAVDSIVGRAFLRAWPMTQVDQL